MLLYNVIASRPVPRPGGIDYYPSVINTEPVGKEQADSMLIEQTSRGIRCRLEGVVGWATQGRLEYESILFCGGCIQLTGGDCCHTQWVNWWVGML